MGKAFTPRTHSLWMRIEAQGPTLTQPLANINTGSLMSNPTWTTCLSPYTFFPTAATKQGYGATIHTNAAVCLDGFPDAFCFRRMIPWYLCLPFMAGGVYQLTRCRLEMWRATYSSSPGDQLSAVSWQLHPYSAWYFVLFLIFLSGENHTSYTKRNVASLMEGVFNLQTFTYNWHWYFCCCSCCCCI